MTNSCTFNGDREATLVAYVYGELESPMKENFDAHLTGCGLCRLEIAELQGARNHLQAWQPPESEAWSALRDVPAHTRWTAVRAWAQVAAAVMLFGIGLGAANLRVSYAPGGGLLVTTGWMARDRTTAVEEASAPAAQAAAVPAKNPWQGDLDAMARQLRAEFTAAEQQAAGARAQASGDGTLRQARALVADSERKQQRELALRVAEVLRDVQNQRQADLAKIDRSLGVIQNNTGVEVMRQRQLLNSLAVRVSQRQ